MTGTIQTSEILTNENNKNLTDKLQALKKLTNTDNKKIFKHRQRNLEQNIPHHYIIKLKMSGPRLSEKQL